MEANEAVAILLGPIKRGEAERLFRRLLEAVQGQQTGDSSEAAVISNKLGEIIAFDGRHAEAVELFWQAVRASGARSHVSQQVAVYYRNIGLSLANLGRRADAVLAIQSRIGILEQCVGPKHHEVDQARSLLAKIVTGWKPPLPSAHSPSSGIEGDNPNSTTTNAEVAEFDENYATWESTYLKSSPDSPNGYLIRLQRLRTDPIWDSP